METKLNVWLFWDLTLAGRTLLVKALGISKVTYFRTYFQEFGYLNSSCIGKSIISTFWSFSREIYAFVVKLSDRCFCWFPAAMLVPFRMGSNMASPNLERRLLRISCIRKIAVT